MKISLAIGLCVLSLNALAEVPTFNSELGLHPLTTSYNCPATSQEQADTLVMMLLTKSNFEWAKKNCSENLNDVKDAAQKVAAQNKFLDRSVKGCYSAKEAKSLREIISLSIIPGTTCTTATITDSVSKYKKSLESTPNN